MSGPASSEPRTALYICYQSVREPLTQTQAVAYLEGLARVGYGIVLLTFEPEPLTGAETQEWRERMTARGITWHWTRYHKWPSVPATFWDVVWGICRSLVLIRRYRVRLVHARAHVPGMMALMLKWLTGVRFLFDCRGLMAEEYTDAGHWPAGGLLYRMTKRAERRIIAAADGLVVLTARAKELLETWYPRELAGTPVEVVPCCVDLRRAREQGAQAGSRIETAVPRRLAYVGKLGGWYATEEIVDFMAAFRSCLPEVRWSILTQSDPGTLRARLTQRGFNGNVTVGSVPAENVHAELQECDAGLSFIHPSLSKQASSPTKVAEYLAAGLPVVSTAGIGELDRLLRGDDTPGGRAVGVLMHELNPEAYQQAARELLELWKDPELPHRCRAVAERHFDLEGVGWAGYRRMYSRLLGPVEATDD